MKLSEDQALILSCMGLASIVGSVIIMLVGVALSSFNFIIVGGIFSLIGFSTLIIIRVTTIEIKGGNIK
jgi:hypothetical protein